MVLYFSHNVTYLPTLPFSIISMNDIGTVLYNTYENGFKAHKQGWGWLSLNNVCFRDAFSLRKNPHSFWWTKIVLSVTEMGLFCYTLPHNWSPPWSHPLPVLTLLMPSTESSSSLSSARVGRWPFTLFRPKDIRFLRSMGLSVSV